MRSRSRRAPYGVWIATTFAPRDDERFGLDRAQKQGKRNEYFAKRNETFRSAGRKSLISLGSLNQCFRGIVCFQRFKGLFVSPFSALGCHARESGHPDGLSPRFGSRLRGDDTRAEAPSPKRCATDRT